MSDSTVTIGKDFPAVSNDAWREAVDKALKGKPFEKTLMTRLYDGITLKPIYTKDDFAAAGDPSGFPGFAPFERAATVSGTVGRPWDIRQLFTHPDVTQANREIIEDLERGASSVTLRFDAAARAGLDPDAAEAEKLCGVDGIMITSANDLDSALAGVMLDLAPVALDAGASAVAAAAMLAEVWAKRGIKGDVALGAFNIDPLGTLATLGHLPQSVDAALADMAAVAARTARDLPNVTAVGINTAAYYNAGATEVLDLGTAMATGVAYLRAMTEAGMSIDDACRQIAFSLPVGTDQFLSIAKLRAARLLWARVTEVCGASPEARAMRLHVDVSDRVLSQRDPWVNLLRVTIGVFAAGVAQADSITAPTFDAALGVPTGFARRIARNTQIILQEESNLGRVIDPAGGSWYIETLTRQVAEKAWEEFQYIEKLGGMIEALRTGTLKARLNTAWAERRTNIGRRKDQITGVNEFPNLFEKPVEVQTPDRAVLRKAAIARLRLLERAIHAASVDDVFTLAGTSSLGALTAARGGDRTAIEPLARHRLAEDFEDLRDASDVHMALHGERPGIFLANMGPVAKHTARASYARNFFESGGIEGISTDGFADAATMAKAFRDSGAQIACICGTDEQYAEQGAAFASALKSAGALRVYLAGRGGDLEATLNAAGVDAYTYMGCDALDVLRSAQSCLGVQ